MKLTLQKVVDESGNTYVLGGSYSSDFSLKNAWNSTYCGDDIYPCMFLTVFNLRGTTRSISDLYFIQVTCCYLLG